MQQYSDSRGRSGVLGYDVGNDFVTVHFKDGSENAFLKLEEVE
jgi:hypothetical protein